MRRSVRSPFKVTSSQVTRMTRLPASSRSASRAASCSLSRRVRWNSKPSSWTASRRHSHYASTSMVRVSPSTRALKAGRVMSWAMLSNLLNARSSSFFWVLGW